MGFSGWSPEAVEFFEDLQADNTKAFWSAHKDFYDASVREPMAELLDELSVEFGPGRIARPYKDLRFRAGQSPYKTEIYATLDRCGYVRFSADGLTAALGYYMMTGAQLKRYRQAVIDDEHGTWLAELAERLRAEGGAGRWRANAQERPARVSGRPPSDRASALPGADLLATVAGSAMAVYRRGEGPGGGLPAYRGAAAPVAGPAGRTGPRQVISAVTGTERPGVTVSSRPHPRTVI